MPSSNRQPDLSKRLHRLIKSTNTLIAAHSTAARERLSIATQLSEWGEATHPHPPPTNSSSSQGVTAYSGGGGDDGAISDISDKLGVLLSELGEQEEVYAQRLEESRAVLKVIRNTERSVQPSREGKQKIAGEIARVKGREPQSARLVTLEQELVRAEAEGLVAEAQLGNVVRSFFFFFFFSNGFSVVWCMGVEGWYVC
jgi:vacuolar-type H+-ATPase subunit I/STV1